MNAEQKSKAFDMLCNQILERINDEIPDWLNENPFWEIDDDGSRHYPKTTDMDAQNAICEKLLDQADNMGLHDFFELVLHQVCNNPISLKNQYKQIMIEER